MPPRKSRKNLRRRTPDPPPRRGYAGIAQLEEHLFCTQDVAGSIPAIGSSPTRGKYPFPEGDQGMVYLVFIYFTGEGGVAHEVVTPAHTLISAV